MTTSVDSDGHDEIGRLLHAMNGIGHELSSVVQKVRLGTDTIAEASSQIAAGNANLSARSEAQASSLEQTASSMEQLTAAVKQNAEHADQANTLVMGASGVAQKGGQMMTQQNAALVEQATAAADAMRDQARDLSSVVHTFKL